MNDFHPAADEIRALARGYLPRVGLVLGSGLETVVDSFDQAAAIAYDALPGFPIPSVEGHQGQLVLGEWNGVRIACLQGRAHAYEGGDPSQMRLPIRALKSAGCEMLLLTCAAGSLNPAMAPGHLMCFTDHINWSGLSPLMGPNDNDVGPRFVDLTEAYDARLRSLLEQAAVEGHVEWHQGVYLWSLGPNFETPAEIRAFQFLGADAVGMSTVPECLVARHCGLRVAALAVITNFAAGLDSGVLSHEGTLANGQQAVPDMVRLLDKFFTLLNDTEVTGC